MQIKITTPDGMIYQSDEIDSVSVPTQLGEIEILPGHENLISALAPGVVVIRKNKADLKMSISSGVLNIREGESVELMAESAEREADIDVERAKAAKLRAEQYLESQKDIDEVQYARMLAKIQKELARIRLGSGM